MSSLPHPNRARDTGNRPPPRTFDAADVKAAAAGRWGEVYAQLAPELAEAMAKPTRHHPCPVHGGKDGFRLFGDWRESGGCVCATCGPRHDGFATLQWLRGWDFPEALARVAEVSGLDHTAPRPVVRPARVTPPPAPTPDREIQRAIADEWAEAVGLDHPAAAPVRRYLEARGLGEAMPLSPALRCDPRATYWEDGRKAGEFPAMIGRVVDAQGRHVGNHRTFLSLDGRKAPVRDAKKLTRGVFPGAFSGAAIQLFPLDGSGVLGVCEGIETALSVRLGAGMPCWAAISASGLASFEPPPGVQAVHIWADLDRSGAGQEAATKLVERLRHRMAVVVHLPPGEIPEGSKSLDWLDIFNQEAGHGQAI
ncbi:DUF7146 domain-containing protein [Magnetofaba australis]|nr:toprim domain-containing protein [Magnetofaba australis]